MENLYRTLGVGPTASVEEIRVAYRILARRYHPDLNPGKPSEDKFKSIATAYEVLGDANKRKDYDYKLRNEEINGNLHQYFKAYKENQEKFAGQRNYKNSRRKEQWAEDERKAKLKPSQFESKKSSRAGLLPNPFRWIFRHKNKISSVSVIEASVTIREAITGVKKTVEINSGKDMRRVSVSIPPGVRTGSVVQLQSKVEPREAMVLVIRVLPHPILSMNNKGLVAELAVTFREALEGATVKIPTLDDQVLLRIPPNSQSGDELRLKEKGVQYKDGVRGDLYVRIIIKTPTNMHAPGVLDAAKYLDKILRA